MDEVLMKKHFVTFYSPGTLVAETSTKPIEAWDEEEAVEMAKSIKERHGATPYGFRFTTRGRGWDDLNSREIAKSGMYYLGGRIDTLEEVKARRSDADRILILNMEGNGYDKVIVNTNSYKSTHFFDDKKDVLLDVDIKEA